MPSIAVKEEAMTSDAVAIAQDTTVAPEEIGALGAALTGSVLTPDDPGYDEARIVWNGAIDKRPAVIARCAGTADVIDAINFARRSKLLVAVRGGAHNVAGNAVCDDGIVIDLGP
jgi:FAD/FMN-containing dehydrogenase